MTQFTIGPESRYDDQMDRLRAGGWQPPVASARDAFDAHSLHVVARVAGAPVGMVRLTRPMPSVLRQWSHGTASVPVHGGVVELTRAVVDDCCRRSGLYRLLMLESMLQVARLEGTVATAAIEPSFFARRMLDELGFRAVGAPIVFDDAPRAGTVVQCITADVTAENVERWRCGRATHVRSMREAGWVELPGSTSDTTALCGTRLAPSATIRL